MGSLDELSSLSSGGPTKEAGARPSRPSQSEKSGPSLLRSPFYKAPSYGQTIFEYRPDCRGAQDYLALSQETVARR